MPRSFRLTWLGALALVLCPAFAQARASAADPHRAQGRHALGSRPPVSQRSVPLARHLPAQHQRGGGSALDLSRRGAASRCVGGGGVRSLDRYAVHARLGARSAGRGSQRAGRRRIPRTRPPASCRSRRSGQRRPRTRWRRCSAKPARKACRRRCAPIRTSRTVPSAAASSIPRASSPRVSGCRTGGARSGDAAADPGAGRNVGALPYTVLAIEAPGARHLPGR